MAVLKLDVVFGVHHSAVAKLSEHCANLVGVWWGRGRAAAAAADAMRVCILILDQQQRMISVGPVDLL